MSTPREAPRAAGTTIRVCTIKEPDGAATLSADSIARLRGFVDVFRHMSRTMRPGSAEVVEEFAKLYLKVVDHLAEGESHVVLVYYDAELENVQILTSLFGTSFVNCGVAVAGEFPGIPAIVGRLAEREEMRGRRVRLSLRPVPRDVPGRDGGVWTGGDRFEFAVRVF